MSEENKNNVETRLTKFTPDEAIHEVIELILEFLEENNLIEEVTRELEELVSELSYEIAIHLNDKTIVMRFTE